MKIIIIGCGKVGSALAEELTMENHEVAIVDISAQKLQEVGEDLDALQIHGNGSSINVLMDAGVTSADLVIAVTGSDELNLLCCLVAKNLGKCHTVARVRNPIYNKEINLMKESLGISMIINRRWQLLQRSHGCFAFLRPLKLILLPREKWNC